MTSKIRNVFIVSFIFCLLSFTFAQQKPTRVGTTIANFLEYGFGSAASSMGDAYVSMVEDVSAIYWNPAGLAFMPQSEAQFIIQPWILDIKTTFVAVGMVVPSIGTLGVGLIYTGYGEMEVTTLDMQEGTGEKFTANDYAVSLAYSRALTNWFSFGANAKYVASKIWHMTASAMAIDLGVMIKTPFFAQGSDRNRGLRLGMSISNYGTRMKYDGIDLTNPIDPLPDENGNYADVPGKFNLSEWELPLIFRIGASWNYSFLENQYVTLSADALHPNNNTEYVNLGIQYEFNQPSFGRLFLRGGYAKLFMPDNEYGMTLGFGLMKNFIGNFGMKIDYAYREVGILGKVHSYTIGFLF